ncbi:MULTISPECIES: GNAT family N-acetyltransferase [Colwellia]|uniref:N-acetyltransferase n=1 Tax=Colwellia marinimaniae TaxID=1513592 RepID=A0ABQ0MXT5_9GAMM|nr:MULTISPECIES: GNAT family N-acetyltransferase [Colwellia]GAW97187.1 N-acetyltransferase [Colwellia marinimaniae]
MVIIRAARLVDLEHIAELHAQSWRENYQQVLSADYLNDKVFAERLAVWTTRLTTPQSNQLVLVAELEGVFCGFICLLGGNHPKYGTIIDNLHVMSANKGQGTGSRLLAAAASWAAANYKDHDVYLEVLAGNNKAIGFYQAKGATNIATAYWHTPCGNKAKEFIYSWGAPDNLAKGVVQGIANKLTKNLAEKVS